MQASRQTDERSEQPMIQRQARMQLAANRHRLNGAEQTRVLLLGWISDRNVHVTLSCRWRKSGASCDLIRVVVRVSCAWRSEAATRTQGATSLKHKSKRLWLGKI